MEHGKSVFELLNSDTVLYTGKPHSLPSIRAKSRELHAQNAMLAGFTKIYCSLVISDGFSLQLSHKDKELSLSVRDKWDDYTRLTSVDDRSLDAFAHSLIGDIVKAGDILVYATRRSNPYSGKEELKLNLIVAERIKSPSKKQAARLYDTRLKQYIDLSSKFIQDGVVLDEGEELGFTIAPQNANGDWLFIPKFYNNQFSAVLLQNPLRDNLESKRGVPLVAPGLQTISDFLEVRRDEVATSKLRTKAAFIIRMEKDLIKQDATKEQEDELYKLIAQQMERMFNELKESSTNGVMVRPGTELEIRDPKNNISPELEKALLPYQRELASLYGIPFAAIASRTDLETGLTSRQAYSIAFSYTEAIRQNIYNCLFRPFFALWLSVNGYNAQDFKFDFTCRQYGFGKTVEEFNAQKVAVESGLKSLPMAITDIGENPDDVLRSSKEWEESKIKYGFLPEQINTENKGI